MSSYAVTFFIVALLAGTFGSWGVAGMASEIMVLSLLTGRRTPRG